jgi:hypothetical protein
MGDPKFTISSIVRVSDELGLLQEYVGVLVIPKKGWRQAGGRSYKQLPNYQNIVKKMLWRPHLVG